MDTKQVNDLKIKFNSSESRILRLNALNQINEILDTHKNDCDECRSYKKNIDDYIKELNKLNDKSTASLSRISSKYFHPMFMHLVKSHNYGATKLYYVTFILGLICDGLLLHFNVLEILLYIPITTITFISIRLINDKIKSKQGKLIKL